MTAIDCASGSTGRNGTTRFSTDMRAAMLEALDVALLDPSVTEVVLSGNGASGVANGGFYGQGRLVDGGAVQG